MSLDMFIEYISRLYDGDNLSLEELKNLDIKASSLIDLMEKDEIDYDTQNAIDLYISYFDGERYLDGEKTKNVLNYYRIIEDKNNKKLAAEKENKTRTLRIKPINSDGVISAVTIIEAVVVIGMLLAFLTLALLKI